MTENILQTSASDRRKAVEIALGDLAIMVAMERDSPSDRSGAQLARLNRISDALIAATPPTVGESEEQIASGIHARYLRAEFDGDFRYSGEPMRNALTAAVRAGIQSAHETWEPEVALRPTQEQMLRWLGIRHGDPSRGWIVIPHQYIERED